MVDDFDKQHTSFYVTKRLLPKENFYVEVKCNLNASNFYQQHLSYRMSFSRQCKWMIKRLPLRKDDRSIPT